MTHLLEARPDYGHALRTLVGAALCIGLLALLCGGALMNGGTTLSGEEAEKGAGITLTAPAADHSTVQDEGDGGIAPHVDGIGVRHSFRKPRRSNRRLRVPGRAIAHSGSARAGTQGIGTTQLSLESKHTSKRALMRRLMTVRGGLQA